LTTGRIPAEAQAVTSGVGDVRVDGLLRGYDSDIVSTEEAGQHTSKLQRPLFIWYAPRIPHQGGDSRLSAYFKTKYSSFESNAESHLARVSWLDAGVGALLDDLRRTCVCSHGGQPQSLYDNTVVLFIADNGFLLRDAKRNALDNTQRTVLVVNEPGHRGPGSTVPARVVTSELVNAIDLLPTILSYAGDGGIGSDSAIAGEDTTPYPFRKDLRPLIQTAASGALPIVRRVEYGEDTSGGGIQSDDRRVRYLIPRPGEVGVCATATTAGHARPCTDSTTDCGDGGPCVLGTCQGSSRSCVRDAECGANPCVLPGGVTGGGARCTNRPELRCATDQHCAADLCDPVTLTCKYLASPVPEQPPGGRSFADFAPPPPAPGTGGLPCSPPEDCVPAETCQTCVPAGTCQPLLLKVQTDKDGLIKSAWDLNWDPDEKRDLLNPTAGGDMSYLGIVQAGEPFSLADKIQDCFEDYWELRGSNQRWVPPSVWRAPGDPTQCPW
jgi:hypothetical protein